MIAYRALNNGRPVLSEPETAKLITGFEFGLLDSWLADIRAVQLQKEGRKAEATKLFRLSAVVPDKNQRRRIMIGRVKLLQIVNEFDAAHTELQRMLGENPDDLELLFIKFLLLGRQGHVLEQLNFAAEVLRNNRYVMLAEHCIKILRSHPELIDLDSLVEVLIILNVAELRFFSKIPDEIIGPIATILEGDLSILPPDRRLQIFNLLKGLSAPEELLIEIIASLKDIFQIEQLTPLEQAISANISMKRGYDLVLRHEESAKIQATIDRSVLESSRSRGFLVIQLATHEGKVAHFYLVTHNLGIIELDALRYPVLMEIHRTTVTGEPFTKAVDLFKGLHHKIIDDFDLERGSDPFGDVDLGEGIQIIEGGSDFDPKPAV